MLDFSFWNDSRFLLMLLLVLMILILFLGARRSNLFRKMFIFLTVLYNIVYLVWRAVFTLPLSFGAVSIIMGVILLLAEVMGFWQSLVFRVLFWKPFHSFSFPPSRFDNPPSVDVFIASYNESIAILKKTVFGCLNLNYPKNQINIYLCDDGKRQAVKELCDELGIHYLSRESNEHAKAGNLNHALAHSNGDFIMLLDADMVPKSTFLDKTIGYFVDEKVGFVQTPQIFNNPDPFQFNLHMNESIPNEQDFFMVDIQAGRANFNAVLHVGTNAVFRRKAIIEIGGIPTGTITEDMATGMLIQAHGYTSIFVKEVLCTGLSVESFAALVKQRERWCRGNIQVTKKWNPVKIKGLSLIQRIIYVDGFIYWFFGVQKMIYILCPIMYLLFGIIILQANVYDLILFWLPSFIASALTFQALAHKSRSLTWSHIYEVAMAPYLSLAALFELIFARPIRFNVTPKGTSSKRTTFGIRLAAPHIVLFIGTITGWVLILLRLDTLSESGVNSLLINMLWSIYNILAIVTGIMVCLERPRKRAAERVPILENVEFSLDTSASCRIVDISETGARIECMGFSRPEDPAKSKDDSPHNENKGTVEISTREFGRLSGTVEWSNYKNGVNSFGIRFDKQTNAMYGRIAKYIADKNRGYHKNK